MTNTSIKLSYCIAAEIVIAASITVLTALRMGSMISLLFASSFCVVASYMLSTCRRFYVNRTVALLITLCSVNVVANCFLRGGDISFDYLKKLIMFSTFVVLLDYAAHKNYSLSLGALKVIKILPVIAGTFLVLSYYFLGNTARMAGGVTLGFSNPNFAGMWLFHFFLYGCLFIIEGLQTNKMRLLYVPVLLVMLQLIVKTLTRSCLISIAFYFVLLVFGLRKHRMNRFVLFVVALFPMMYAIIYLKIVNTDWFQNLFSFMISVGKNLTSRVWIWNLSLDYFKNSPIFGDYYGISGGSGQSQLHNTHIDVLCSYGIVPLCLFIKVLFEKLTQVNRDAQSMYQYVALCAFCAVIIQGSFEAAVVSGAMGMNLLTVGFIALAYYGTDNGQREYLKNCNTLLAERMRL